MNRLDFEAIFAALPGLYSVLDRGFHTVAVSDAYLRATLRTREELLGRSLFDVFPANPQTGGAGQEAVRAVFERVLAERSAQKLALQRYDVPRPEGGFEKRYWSALVTPLAGADGEVEYLLCAVEDATDRAREAHLRKALAVDAIGVIFFDQAGTLISANDTFLRWTGYTREEVAAGGITWRSLTPPEYHDSGRMGPYEKEYFTKDGSRRWMLSVGAALDDGTAVEYVIDISKRKAAEQAKREMEERYRMLFDSIDAGYCVIEVLYDAGGRPMDYRFLEVNPAFERQTGLSDAMSKTIREHVPEHEQHWYDIYGRVAETGEPVRFVQEAKALMGGFYEVFAFRAGAPGSRKVGVLFNDITEQVRARQALQDEARRKDEFLATLAHELRNPLAPIRNAVSLLRMRAPADPELGPVSELIDRQVTHLARLVDDLLDVSRISFGKLSVQRAPVDLREVARDAVATSEPLLAAANHRLTLTPANGPVWVDGDRVRLAQVIANLLNNAARYTPPGGSITLEVAAVDGEARVAVEDNGIGIEPTLLERVFEPFTQLEERDSLASGGIGIGLALAKALVDLHGGRISAHSAGRGTGSRFVVHLPRIAAPKAAATGAAAIAGKPRRRLLLVDDNVDAASSQASLLRLLGHEVEVAHDGVAALEKARRFRPEVVLLDLGMPGMDGFEVARRLRASHEGRDLKLVAQTGWGQEDDRRRTREAGFDAHLAKPIDLAALERIL